MQTVSNLFLNQLRADSKNLTTVVEFYLFDAKPIYDPANSNFLFGFSSRANISFRGRSFLRLIAENSTGKINKVFGKTLSGYSVNLQNENRQITDFENSIGFEGLVCVVRSFDAAVSVALADSMVLFTGSSEPLGAYRKSDNSYNLNVTQTLNQTNLKMPRRNFTAQDLSGRAESDPEFEGFVHTPRMGSVNYPEKVSRGGLFGTLFHLKKTVTQTKPYSSHSDLQEETPVPVVLGRVQMEMIVFAYEDAGEALNYVGFWADGHEYGIEAVNNLRSVSPDFPIRVSATKLGKRGGAVDDANTQTDDDQTWVAHGIYSRTAYSRCGAGGSTLQNEDGAPVTVAMILGQKMPVPDGSGVFTNIVFTDNPTAHARWILSSQYFFGLTNEFFDDSDNLESFKYNDHTLADTARTDTVALPVNQIGFAGTQYKLFKSTSALSPDFFKNNIAAYQIETPYDFFDEPPINSDDPLGAGVPVLPAVTYRRRYAANVALVEQKEALDFLYDILFPTANLFFVQKADGRFAIRNKKPADGSFFFSASAVGAAEICIKNINPFVGKPGKILIGANLANSEVREIVGTRYKTDVSIAVSATGGVSSSAGTLGNGSNTVAPNALLTVTSAAGNKTVTIAGLAQIYYPQPGETTVTAAGAIAGAINANEELNKFIKAVWNGDATITISSRVGFLTLDAALENAHVGAIADPSAAAPLTAISGALAAGTYQYSYSFETPEGETLVAPVTQITIAANKNIQTAAISRPARVLQVRHYISTEPGGVRRKLIKINQGESFVIDKLPLADDRLEPMFNTTSEELHRIVMTFTDRGNAASNLTRSNILSNSLVLPAPEKSVNQVKIKYRDAAADYKLTTLVVNDYVRQKKAKKTITFEINGAGVDNHHQAQRLANQKLAELADGNRFAGVTGDNEALLLEEGDIVCITDADVGYRNEPVRIDKDISITTGNYPTISFSGRKYRRYFYDDQPNARIVPLPIVQNNDINREQQPPTIEQIGASKLTSVQIGIKDYDEAATKFRKIQIADNIAFTSGLETAIHEFSNTVNAFSSVETVARTSNLTVSQTKYIRVAHSSNGIFYGAWSNTLAVIFQNETGDGTAVLKSDPPLVYTENGNWRVQFDRPLQNGFTAKNLEFRLLDITANVVLYDGLNADGTPSSANTSETTGLPDSGKVAMFNGSDLQGETIGYTTRNYGSLGGFSRGLEHSAVTDHYGTVHVYPVVWQQQLGDVLAWIHPQLTNDVLVQYRWQNGYRENDSDGWSMWSSFAPAYGTGNASPPPEATAPPPPPPASEPPPPAGYEDPLVAPENRRYKTIPDDFY